MRPTVLEGVLYLYCVYIAQISFFGEFALGGWETLYVCPLYLCGSLLRAYSLLGWFLG